MKYMLLILATVMASSKAIICKKIGQDNSDGRGTLIINANAFLIAAITILLCFLRKINTFLNISTFSLLLSVGFAAFLLFTQIMQILSMSRGYSSLTSLIYSFGFIIPILYSVAFLGETVSPYQILGIFLIGISLFISLPPDKNGKFSFVWLAFAVAAMLGSGTNAVIQKIHQSSTFKNELIPFIFFSLLFASVFSFLLSLAMKDKGGIKWRSIYTDKKILLLMIADGAVVGILNFANLSLAGRVPAVIQFPVYNVVSMILTALAGSLFFAERPGLRKSIGFIVGLIAITVIALL